MGLREELLKPRPRRTKKVNLGTDFGGLSVSVRSLTAGEKGRFEAQFLDKKTGRNRADRVREVRERLVIACAVDDGGELLFTVDDLPTLSDVDAAIITAIADAAGELNRISEDDIGELAGN